MVEETIEVELQTYFNFSEVAEVLRSQIHPAEYNPRRIDEQARKKLKKGVKTFGVVGGIVINKQTGYTIVGGHQKIDILDEINKYNAETHKNDYKLRVELVDLDLTREKELNVLLNNASVTGDWDYDKLRQIVPDIDYKNAGLTEADLSMIGMDFIFKTEEENNLSNALDDLMAPVEEQHRQEVADRAELREQQREEIRKAQEEANAIQSEMDNETPEEREARERQAKIDHMKDVKEQVKSGAIENAQNQDAYFMLSFDTWESKVEFCEAFGIDPNLKFVKGEWLRDRLLEGADDSME